MKPKLKINRVLLIAFVSLMAVSLACTSIPIPFLDEFTNQNQWDEYSKNADTPAELQDLFSPFWEAWSIVQEDFVDPVDDADMMRGGAEGILNSLQQQLGPEEDLEALQAELESLTEELSGDQTLGEIFAPFWDAWGLVTSEYPEVDTTLLMQGAIAGSLYALGDEHTAYMDPFQYQQANTALEGEYEGIGAWVDTSGQFLTIISPMSGSPAEEAGLLPGDEIIAVDGNDMEGIDPNLVIRSVLGPAGTDVVLTVRREGQDPFDVTVTRGHIIIPSVESRMLDGDIAYLQLYDFGDRVPDRVREHLETLLAQDPAGLILDLRNNGGGFLHVAIEVTSEFISSGDLMYEDYGDGTRDTYTAIEGGLATDIPLVVLVNQGSASASEILAGAVQDYERGYLVGMTTFGKGSVQNWVPLSNDQGAVRVTIARWLTPDERLIHQIGIEPDYIVPYTEEDMAAERDPQLEKAVELLLDS